MPLDRPSPPESGADSAGEAAEAEASAEAAGGLDEIAMHLDSSSGSLDVRILVRLAVMAAAAAGSARCELPDRIAVLEVVAIFADAGAAAAAEVAAALVIL